jgi:CDGSH-type Zn-finger protein
MLNRRISIAFARALSTQAAKPVAPAEVALSANKDYFWCTCSKSLKQVSVVARSPKRFNVLPNLVTPLQPFCDGSHKGSGLKSLKFSVPSDATKFLCSCKLTKAPPFCDGSHLSAAALSSSQRAGNVAEQVRAARRLISFCSRDGFRGRFQMFTTHYRERPTSAKTFFDFFDQWQTQQHSCGHM